MDEIYYSKHMTTKQISKPTVELIQIEGRDHALIIGNISNTFRNQLKRLIGKHEDINFYYDKGTVKNKEGKSFDWWMNENGKVECCPAE